MAGLAHIYDTYVTTSTVTFELTAPGPDVWAQSLRTWMRPAGRSLVANSRGALGRDCLRGSVAPAPGVRAHGRGHDLPRPGRHRPKGIGTRLWPRPSITPRPLGRRREVVAVIMTPRPRLLLPCTSRPGSRQGALNGVGRKFDRWLGTTLLQKTLTTE